MGSLCGYIHLPVNCCFAGLGYPTVRSSIHCILKSIGTISIISAVKLMMGMSLQGE